MKTKVLIVEDDADLGHLLKQYLQLNDFEATRVYDGEQARAELKVASYDILILDVMMPKEDGFELAAKLNVFYPDIPFLFVTARKMKHDVLFGLKLGAEDYIIKPFDADELIQRLHNILKRTRKRTVQQATVFQIGLYSFNPSNLLLAAAGTEKILTQQESRLLEYFCTHPNQLIRRNDILDHLWKEADFFNGRSMDVFISRLRKYLSQDQNIQIESIRGVGFRFINSSL